MRIYKIVLDDGSVYGQTKDPVEALLCLAKLTSCGRVPSLEIKNAHMLKGA